MLIEVFMVLLSPPAEFWDSILKLGHNSFLSSPEGVTADLVTDPISKKSLTLVQEMLPRVSTGNRLTI
jgi:hypothetical protein